MKLDITKYQLAKIYDTTLSNYTSRTYDPSRSTDQNFIVMCYIDAINKVLKLDLDISYDSIDNRNVEPKDIK